MRTSLGESSQLGNSKNTVVNPTNIRTVKLRTITSALAYTAHVTIGLTNPQFGRRNRHSSSEAWRAAIMEVDQEGVLTALRCVVFP
jgi:hypothetical protein